MSALSNYEAKSLECISKLAAQRTWDVRAVIYAYGLAAIANAVLAVAAAIHEGKNA